MKRNVSLKWHLMWNMVGLWFVVSLLIFVRVGATMGELNQTFDQVIAQFTQARAVIVASRLSAIVRAGNREGAIEQLERYRQERPEIVYLSVLDAERKPIYRIDGFEDEEKWLSMSSTLSIDSPLTIGPDRFVALVPIDSESESLGYVILVVGKMLYQERRRASIFKLATTIIAGIVLTAIAAFFIGRRITRPIDNLVEASERFAGGDLTRIHFDNDGALETKRLGDAIRLMAEAMQSQVAAIKKLTNDVASVSEETVQTMTKLAASASQQAAAVNQTAATVEQMEKAGRSTELNAKNIVTAAGKSAEASSRGRQTVEKTYQIIMQIKDDSHDLAEKNKNLLNTLEEVNNIIQSVNAIAEQSKILAVNASIEAAKAGKFGSGFAVVAQEVKDLAQQSKDATLQITGTINAIRNAIETMASTAQLGKERTSEGVHSVANTGAVMNDLSEAIRENSEFASLIAGNIKQQTIGLTQIAAAVEEISATAMENQLISRDIVDGTKQINETLARLSEMVDNWRTEDDAG